MADESNNNDYIDTDNLSRFLKENQDKDFLHFDLQTEESLSKLNFQNLIKQREEIILQLKAFQRLLRIIPEKNHEIALSLIQRGIISALQIAAMPRRNFMKKCAGLFESNAKLADEIYKNALAKRSAILVQYMNAMQNNEPHISAARFH